MCSRRSRQAAIAQRRPHRHDPRSRIEQPRAVAQPRWFCLVAALEPRDSSPKTSATGPCSGQCSKGPDGRHGGWWLTRCGESDSTAAAARQARDKIGVSGRRQVDRPNSTWGAVQTSRKDRRERQRGLDAPVKPTGGCDGDSGTNTNRSPSDPRRTSPSRPLRSRRVQRAPAGTRTNESDAGRGRDARCRTQDSAYPTQTDPSPT